MPYQSEAELLAALRESEFWKYLAQYLEDRREMLFATDLSAATDPINVYKAQGAIAEVTRLKNLPNLILAKMAMDAQRRREQEFQAAQRPPEDYDG